MAALLAVVIHILLLLFITIGKKLWHWNSIEQATVMYSNAGNMIIPLVSAILAGLLLFFFQIKLPADIKTPIQDIGNMLAPLSMIVTGMLMAQSPISESLKNKRIYLFSAIRLVIWPLLLLQLMYVSNISDLLPDGKVILLIVYLASITPSASTVTQMAQVYDKDAHYSGILNVFTTLFCIVTMPVAIMLFSHLIH